MLGEALIGRKKQRWVLAAFFFLSGILAATWSSRIPDLQQKLHLNNRSLGTVLFAIPLGLVIGLLLGGRIVAFYGAKRTMVVASMVAASALILTALTTTSLQLMLALFLMGVGRTILNLSINTSAVELQKQYEKPIVSSFHGIWSVACFFAALAGTAMIVKGVTPLSHFIGAATITLSAALLLIRNRKKTNASSERKPFFVKPDNYLFLLGLIALCAMLCEGAVFDWSVNYFEKVIRTDKSFVTAGYTSFIVTMAAGRLLGDRLILSFGIYRMLCVNGALMAAGFAIAALFPFLLAASFGFFLIGFGDSILVPMVYLLASKSSKMPPNYALQAVTLIGYTGFLIGPLFIGNVSQSLGMSTAFFALSGISLLIIFLSLQVKKLSVNA